MPEKCTPVEGDVIEQYTIVENIAYLVKEGHYIVESVAQTSELNSEGRPKGVTLKLRTKEN